MPTKAVQVSIDVELLRRVDAHPETRERGRSAFVRSAIESYLRAKKRREIDEAISTAFGKETAAMLDEVDVLLEAQAWPDD
jgi:metal-responsive CopG/Arc/MetJ family transcriptional regulator